MKPIKFEDLKVGQTVWTIQYGWTQIIRLDDTDFPIVTNDAQRFTKEGKLYETDVFPSMFLEEPFIERMMEVSDNETHWEKRRVVCKYNNRYHAVNELDKSDLSLIPWKYAREIQPETPCPYQPKEIVVDGVTYIRKEE